MNTIHVSLLTFFLSALAPALPSQDPTLVLRGGHLFDATTQTRRPLAQLWIAGDRILGERPGDHAIPDGVEVRDTTGKTVLPGLFDLHVHIGVGGGSFTSMVPITPADNLRSHLHCGVTHVVDLHADEQTIFAVRDESRRTATQARLYTAGAAFTRPHGHATQFGVPANTVDTVDDVDRRMKALLPRRPDVIKAVVENGGWGGLNAFPTLDAKLFSAISGHAQRASLPLFSHVWSTPEALLAASHGADALAHGVFLGPVSDELLTAMREHGTAYIPTLAVVLAAVHTQAKDSPYQHDLVSECIHPDLVSGVLDESAQLTLLASPMVRLGRRQEKLYLNNLAAMHEAGVPIGIGTDAGNPMVLHGPALLFELDRYVAAGLTPAQALHAATLASARILRVDDDFGSLAEGKVADLVVIDGDPTSDISAMWQIEAVYKAGQAVDRSLVRRRMAELAAPAVVAQAGDDGVPALLDDFADRDLEGNWGGQWEITTDKIAGGNSKGQLDIVEHGGKPHLRVRGEVLAGFRWGPWCGTAIQWHPSGRKLIDASSFEGLELLLRATERGYTVTCHRAAVKDFNYWTTSFEATGDWQTVRIPFDTFRQIGFGKPLDWSATDLKGLQVEARNSPLGGATGPFTIEIAHVSLYR